MQISSAYRFIFMQIKVIFIRMVSHVDSFWNRGTGQLGIGLLFSILCRQIPVPQEARAVLWDHCIRLINRTFVEGWVSYLDKWIKSMLPSTVLCFHDVLTGIASVVLVFNSNVLYWRFASAKKCSNEGRALMQLDFQQYLMKLEKLTDIR